MLEKFLRSFTQWEVDLKYTEQLIIEHLKRFEKKDVTWKNFGLIEKERRVELMSDFLVETFGETLGHFVDAQNAVFNIEKNPICSEFYVCQICAKANRTEEYSPLQKYSARAMGFVFAWTWGLDKQIDTLKLYDAVLTGNEQRSCHNRYGKMGGVSCILYPWMMENDQEMHTEL